MVTLPPRNNRGDLEEADERAYALSVLVLNKRADLL
jgi:hypothetical protein